MFLGVKTGGHDAAAALVDDAGTVVAAVAQERLDRCKHSTAFPAAAIRFCLAEAGAGPREIRAVYEPYNYRSGYRGFAVAPAFRYHSGGLRWMGGIARHLWNKRRQGEAGLRELGFSGSFVDLDHHDCHAASAYYASPFDRATVLTVDGQGESATARVYEAQGASVRRVASLGRYPHSVGLVYTAVTRHLGFLGNCDEGKVMALASFGDADRFAPVVDRLLRSESGELRVDLDLFNHRPPWRGLWARFSDLTCPPRREGEELEPVHADLAAALQAATERVVLALAREAVRRAPSRRLCLSGGVALNSVANGRLWSEGVVSELHVQSAPADDGAALGAAIAGYCSTVKPPEKCALGEAVFVGPGYGGEHAVASFLRRRRSAYRTTSSQRVAVPRVVELLQLGLIVGLYEGRAEFGPRALGHRSILANPSVPEIANVLNRAVKFREPFRPFAVAVLAEDAERLFESITSTPHMSMVFRARPEARMPLCGAVHVDGTIRVQTVEPDGPRLLRKILEEWRVRTGLSALINTSLNVKNQPIVDTPEQALDCLDTTGMDALLLEDVLLEKVGADAALPARGGLDTSRLRDPGVG